MKILSKKTISLLLVATIVSGSVFPGSAFASSYDYSTAAAAEEEPASDDQNEGQVIYDDNGLEIVSEGNGDNDYEITVLGPDGEEISAAETDEEDSAEASTEEAENRDGSDEEDVPENSYDDTAETGGSRDGADVSGDSYDEETGAEYEADEDDTAEEESEDEAETSEEEPAVQDGFMLSYNNEKVRKGQAEREEEQDPYIEIQAVRSEEDGEFPSDAVLNMYLLKDEELEDILQLADKAFEVYDIDPVLSMNIGIYPPLSEEEKNTDWKDREEYVFDGPVTVRAYMDNAMDLDGMYLLHMTHNEDEEGVCDWEMLDYTIYEGDGELFTFHLCRTGGQASGRG